MYICMCIPVYVCRYVCTCVCIYVCAYVHTTHLCIPADDAAHIVNTCLHVCTICAHIVRIVNTCRHIWVLHISCMLWYSQYARTICAHMCIYVHILCILWIPVVCAHIVHIVNTTICARPICVYRGRAHIAHIVVFTICTISAGIHNMHNMYM